MEQSTLSTDDNTYLPIKITDDTYNVSGDAALTNVWTQDAQTVVAPDDAVAEVRGGALYLQSGSANKNNGDGTPPPAVFLNETMNNVFEALYQANPQAVRSFELDFTPTVVKADGSAGSNIGFGMYLNYQGPNSGLFLGYNTLGGWFWQQYGPSFSNSYGTINGPVLTPGETYHMEFLQSGSSTSSPTHYELWINGAKLTEGGFTTLSTANGDSRKIGFKLGTYNGERTGVTIQNVHYSGQAIDAVGYAVSGTVTDKRTGAPIEGVAVMVSGKNFVTDAQGRYVIDGGSSLLPGVHTLRFYKDFYQPTELEVTVGAGDLAGQDAAMELLQVNTATLTTADMDVLVDADFPRAIQYNMKGAQEGKVLYGQIAVLDTVTINGQDIVPTVTSEVAASGDRISYTMAAQGTGIDCVIHAELVAEGKTLSFNINRIDNYLDEISYPVERISIPNHSLISVQSTQAGASFIGNRLAANTITSGDFRYAADEFAGADNQRFIYAFLSNDELSAGIASNSEWGTGTAAGNNHRVLANAEDRAGYVSLGLSSSEWYYDRLVSSSDGNAINNSVIPDAQKVVGPTELPLYVKVVVTGDENGDESVNWQDAAIAARDTIVHKPFKGGEVREIVGTRIALNFGSQAQNPFLTSLDNVKRVYLNTDGLGQGILLKGYGNEGHDSGHGDYADVGRRMGGVPDMLTMMEEGAGLGARFGIHVNASEFYPESKSFTDKTVRREDNGTLRYGWNWLDMGVGINGLYDLASGNRAERFNALGAEMNGLLDFVYVDVWGNNTSGTTEDAWQTRKLSQELVDNGWRVTHEWGYANEWESTFQHWISDYTYGDYSQKGKYNSTVERFLLNSYKDTFAPDFPRMGGNANAPLLGGAVMQGFEGWQSDGEYDEAMEVIFEHLIPTKFLQHYDIMQWVDADQTVALPWFPSHDNNSGGVSNWTPEVQITLQDAARGSTVVVTRGSDETVNDVYTYGTDAEKQEYRSRTITLDGRVILRGAAVPAAGVATFMNGASDDVIALAELANQEYLIPWLWDKDGNPLSSEAQKLYHRSDLGGESTWELPGGWESLANVKMYRLTDNGRVDETIVPVVNGTVTLTAEAKVPYVVVKGDSGAAAPSVEWSTGLHLVDVGFNSTSVEDHWTVDGAGTAVRHITDRGQSVLKLVGAVSVSQEYNNLIPGKTYVTYVSVDNRSDAKAFMTVDVDGTVLASNYTLRSLAKNYISGYSLNNSLPIEGGASYFQNMYVFFTAPESGKVTLTLSREAGTGNTYFDDVRTLETGANNLTLDGAGNIVKFTQDFEHVAQGGYPFVVGPGSGGVQDNYFHLSERHDPYTSAGWNVRKIDDVLNGNWSLKLADRNSRTDLVTQTIPQNFRFEPGVTYSVSFDYQMGAENAYEVVVGVGEWGTGTYTVAANLKKALGATATCKFTVVGDPSGQTWIGIKGSGDNSDWNNYSSSADIFAGYRYFILDDLVIERSAAQKGELANLIATASKMLEMDYSGDWAGFEAALSAAQTVMNNQKATQERIDDAAAALKAAIERLTRLEALVSGTVTVDGQPAAGVVIEVQDTAWQPQGITVVTDADGSFVLPAADMHIMDYLLKVTAAGCPVESVGLTGLVGNVPKTLDVSLTSWDGSYAVNFDDGDVSMIDTLPGSTVGTVGTNQSADYANPSENRREYDGTALWFWIVNDDRTKNNIINTEIEMVNGTVAFDVIPLYSNNRFGITLRGVDGENRIFVGQFAGTNTWGWEYWPNNAWSPSRSGPTLSGGSGQGELRHLEATLDGNTLTLKVDGAVVIDHETLSNPPASIGFVGFNHMNTVGAEFLIDNFTVVPTDAPAANTHTVSGSVTGGGGSVVNAQVVLLDADGTAVTRTTTGVDGSFKTLSVPDGTYTVKVSAPGYGAMTAQAPVSGGDVVMTPINLEVDVSQLQKLYDDNKDKVQDSYTDASWEVFQAALAQAKAALDAPRADTVAAAYNALSGALSALTVKPVDKSLLRTYYNSYSGYTSGDYTASSWEAFQAALNTAAELLKSVSATQKEIDAATDALIAAEQALTRVTEASQLQALYDQYKDQQNENYTAASWNAFQDALKNAAAVLGNANATQAEVDAAYTALVNAVNGLTTAVEPSQLQALYDQHKDQQNENYTTASWNAFQDALKNAAAVLGNANATQAEVDAAYTALVNAVNGLTKNSGDGGNDGGSGGGGGGSSTGTTTTTTQNPDGSTTVTVVDNATGTVTETTTAKDGTKSVTETKKDGTVTSTVTISNQAEGLVKVPVKSLPVGSTITITAGKPTGVVIPVVNAKPGYVAVLVKADGTEEIIRKSVTGKDGITLTVDGAVTLKLKDNSKHFSDVAAGNWAADAVAFASSRELFQGTGANTFAPDMFMTRSMLVTVLYRLENEPEASDGGFADVPAGTWFSEAVGWASSKGIVNGTGAGFDPDGNITRESLVVMLYRYARASGLAVSGSTAVGGFNDADSVSSWAAEAMGWAVGAGIITGKADSTLDPGGTATRAEVATMLMRFVNTLNEG